MKGWWLLFRSRVELVDTAVINAREALRLRQENAAVKKALRHKQVLLELAVRDLSIALEMTPNEVEIRRVLHGLHALDAQPEVQP